MGFMSGRALFQFNPDLFEDDADAAGDEAFAEEIEGEDAGEEETRNGNDDEEETKEGMSAA